MWGKKYSNPDGDEFVPESFASYYFGASDLVFVFAQ